MFFERGLILESFKYATTVTYMFFERGLAFAKIGLGVKCDSIGKYDC
jgi:hypothetical protein